MNSVRLFCQRLSILVNEINLTKRDRGCSHAHRLTAYINTPSRIKHSCADPTRLSICTTECAATNMGSVMADVAMDTWLIKNWSCARSCRALHNPQRSHVGASGWDSNMIVKLLLQRFLNRALANVAPNGTVPWFGQITSRLLRNTGLISTGCYSQRLNVD